MNVLILITFDVLIKSSKSLLIALIKFSYHGLITNLAILSVVIVI